MVFNMALWSQECSLMWTLFQRNINKERHDAVWIRLLLVILWSVHMLVSSSICYCGLI